MKFAAYILYFKEKMTSPVLENIAKLEAALFLACLHKTPKANPSSTQSQTKKMLLFVSYFNTHYSFLKNKPTLSHFE